MTSTKTRWLLTLGAALLLPAACAKKTDATIVNFTDGMKQYLDQRGDLCLGKSVWPIDVTERDAETGARNAVQMPVLEGLGLVSSSDAFADIKTEDETVTVKVKRYQLTEAGKRYYLTRDTNARTPSGEVVHESDFCAAKLSLDKVVGWELGEGERNRAVVTYTYRIEAAEWARTPEARRVFPAVDRVLLGEGVAQLKEGFTLSETGWVANELVPPAALIAQTSVH